MDMFIICLSCMAAGYFFRISQELEKQEEKRS